MQSTIISAGLSRFVPGQYSMPRFVAIELLPRETVYLPNLKGFPTNGTVTQFTVENRETVPIVVGDGSSDGVVVAPGLIETPTQEVFDFSPDTVFITNPNDERVFVRAMLEGQWTESQLDSAFVPTGSDTGYFPSTLEDTGSEISTSPFAPPGFEPNQYSEVLPGDPANSGQTWTALGKPGITVTRGTTSGSDVADPTGDSFNGSTDKLTLAQDAIFQPSYSPSASNRLLVAAKFTLNNDLSCLFSNYRYVSSSDNDSFAIMTGNSAANRVEITMRDGNNSNGIVWLSDIGPIGEGVEYTVIAAQMLDGEWEIFVDGSQISVTKSVFGSPVAIDFSGTTATIGEFANAVFLNGTLPVVIVGYVKSSLSDTQLRAQVPSLDTYLQTNGATS
jgi:hypothetical protein